MNTFLFTWNPDKWHWTTLDQRIKQLTETGITSERWRVASHKSIQPSDRAFLTRVGVNPKGIFAAGRISKKSFLSQHWRNENRPTYSVIIDFDVLIDPDKKDILTLDILKTGNLVKQNWTPQASGISIRPELTKELESIWSDFLKTENIHFNSFSPSYNENVRTYMEGAPNEITLTLYERDIEARKKCINHYGYVCTVCKFDFEKQYGELGRHFIHVHHLTKLSTIRKAYKVDPIRDLRPVCPNCHAMLHKENPPLSIEYLKSKLSKQQPS